MAEGPRRRLQLVSVLLIGCVLVIVAQLFKVQIWDHRFYQEWAVEQRVRAVTVAEPPRGVIRDRNGRLLAGNKVMYSIEAAPVYVMNKENVAHELSMLLHVPAANIERKLDTDSLWVPLASPVLKETKEQLEALNLPGITARPLWKRDYPEGSLASHVLGFYSAAGRGYYGLEGFYDVSLQPERVEREGPVDTASALIPWEATPVVLPKPGTELELTLDRTVQGLVEEELAYSVEAYQADGGTIIVMDPRTFGILALASLPDYAPGRFLDFMSEEPSVYEDPAVSRQYEPGSVFKILTVAAALDAGVVTPETTYYDEGWIEVGGHVIKNAAYHPAGDMAVTDILIDSLNVGTAWLSTEMGADLFYRYLRAFGIGRTTGIDLAGEVAGQVWTPDDYENWYDGYLGTNSFGQGVAVTPLQMIVAAATVANDGARMRPHIVRRRIAPDGAVSIFQPTVEKQVISPQTARALTEILVRTVEEGDPHAMVEGYRVAGKTGTAEIPVPGGYLSDETITSFVGFGPVPDPQLVILIKLDRPKTSHWASETAAWTFHRLATRLFTVLGIPPGDDNIVAEATE
jgi:cell division protein FtsI/penicillin-binding protein 2